MVPRTMLRSIMGAAALVHIAYAAQTEAPTSKFNKGDTVWINKPGGAHYFNGCRGTLLDSKLEKQGEEWGVKFASGDAHGQIPADWLSNWHDIKAKGKEVWIHNITEQYALVKGSDIGKDDDGKYDVIIVKKYTDQAKVHKALVRDNDDIEHNVEISKLVELTVVNGMKAEILCRWGANEDYADVTIHPENSTSFCMRLKCSQFSTAPLIQQGRIVYMRGYDGNVGNGYGVILTEAGVKPCQVAFKNHKNEKTRLNTKPVSLGKEWFESAKKQRDSEKWSGATQVTPRQFVNLDVKCDAGNFFVRNGDVFHVMEDLQDKQQVRLFHPKCGNRIFEKASFELCLTPSKPLEPVAGPNPLGIMDLNAEINGDSWEFINYDETEIYAKGSFPALA